MKSGMHGLRFTEDQLIDSLVSFVGSEVFSKKRCLDQVALRYP